ncbi:hypothetical protein R3P38DRAFT_2814340 [Favolaschia claudopus]|uniref:Uncharacterized protein n=1 Tax=Favolaschia claudopus TaxID=2862362 RepID=A0AAV9Z3Q9_9AGAR
MVETKRVPNSLQISLVSPQTPEQVPLTCYIDLNGKRKAWTESPRVAGHLTFLTWSNTVFEAIRNTQDNPKARTLSFGKETADQAIQQGNAREIVGGHRVNRRTYSSVQHDGQQYITKYGTPQSLIVANQPSLTLAIFPGNAGLNSVRQAPKPVESTPPLAAWEGIHATFLNNALGMGGIHATYSESVKMDLK